MTTAEQFFFDNAGYSWNPDSESQQQGRTRTAQALARAEQYARNLGWSYEWSDDWGVGSHKKYYGAGSAYDEHEPNSCEQCLLFDEEHHVMESLGCIDDADSAYRRVIEAELALAALVDFDREIETLDAH